MKRITYFLVLLFAAAFGVKAYDVTGTVVDSHNDPIIRMAVRLLNPKDSTACGGSITNDNGKFKIDKVNKGKYILETSYIGYITKYRNIEVKGNLNVGSITMMEDAELLRDVTVVGIQTPIRVAEDTVEFNASSYKTQPNAVVEDLLKRLPGVDVGSDGKITHNGKQISKILVDGQEFFSDDPSMASKNLPANMIDKLQVVDRKSDLARLTGVDDGEDETVINLTVKNGMNNGWIGDVEAGYGTDGRYKGSFMLNRFSNKNQFTILGAANNVNDLRFTDGGGRFMRFGGNNGITASQVLGINFNVGNEEVFRVGGDLKYAHTNSHTTSKIDRQYTFPDSISFYDQNRESTNRGHNVKANFRLRWKPDSSNTIDFRPNFGLNFNNSESDNLANTFAGNLLTNSRGHQVNRSSDIQNSKGNSYDIGARLIFNHNFRSHPGRSFSISANASMSNQREKANTYAEIMYYLLQKDSIYDQFEDNHTWNNNISARATWTEPLGNPKKGNFLEFAYSYSYRWNNADRLTYDRPAMDDRLLFILEQQPGDILNDSLSNRFRNDYMNQDIRVGYKYVSKKQNLNAGISVVPQMSKSINMIDDNKTIPERWVWNIAPYLRYRWKISTTRNLQVNYRGRSRQPSMSQLQPVADMSDPLNIVQGNPDLDPSFTHNIDANFRDFNMEAQRSIMVALGASATQNSIVSRTTFDPKTGGKFTSYENVNGVWSLNGFTMVSFPFRNKVWTFNNHFGGNYSHDVGFNNGKRNTARNLTFFESPGIAYRPDYLELEVRPTYNLQYTDNSLQQGANIGANKVVHRFGGRFSGTWTAPFGLVLNTDLNYSATRGYTDGYNTNEWMWNASISYEMLSERNLILTLEGHDLLQQRKNVQRSVTANYIQDGLYNSLTRYVMLTVSYKINTLKSKKMREGFGPDGPDGPGFGPGPGMNRMGPPPTGGRGGMRPPF